MAHFSLGLVPLYALTVVVQTVLRVGANLQVMPSHGAVGAAAVDLGVKVLTISVSLAILWIVIERRTASSVTPPLETAT
jgi:heme/copper-type cytochrome/quinol oxidase subunit 2